MIDDGWPNPPVAFEQDPEFPDGTGTFRFKDGSELLAHEPELARTLRERLDADKAPDKRTAEADAPLEFYPGGNPEFVGGPKLATDAAPPPLIDENLVVRPDDASSALGRFGDIPQETPPAPAAPPSPAPAAPAAPAPQPEWTKRQTVHSAPRAGGVVPTKQSTTVESEGAPYSVEDAMSREEANRAVVGAQLAKYDAERVEAEGQAEAARAALPALEYERKQKEHAFAKLEEGYKIERARVRTIIQENQKNAKVDAGRFYRKAGTAGTIAMIIGQALGAYGAILSGGDNYAAKLVSESHDRDMREQEIELEQLGPRADNMLARLSDQLGDVEQAKSALKIAQSEHLERQLIEYKASAKSAEVARAADLWLAQNQEQRLREEQRFRDLSIGKVTTATQADVVAPRAGGSRPETDEEMAKRLEGKAKVVKAFNEIGYQESGGDQAGKLADRGAAAGERTDKQDVLQVEGFGKARTPKEAIQARELLANYEAGQKALDDLEASTGWSANVPLSTARTHAEQAQRRSSNAIAKAQGGPVTQSDRDFADSITADPTGLFKGNEKEKIRVARQELRNRTNAALKQLIAGDTPELPEER